MVLEFFSACGPAQEGGASDGRGGGELGGGQNFGPQGGVQTAESLIFLFLGFLSANNHTKKHSRIP